MRVSSATPRSATCNRNTERLGEISPTRSVCKNLFGPVDHEALREEIKKERREHLDAKKKKYNFDFEKGCPLVGRYLWEPITNCGSSPTEEKPLTAKGNCADESETTAWSVKEGHCNKVLKSDANVHRITSFFRVKKRKLEEASQDGGNLTETGGNRSDETEIIDGHTGRKRSHGTGRQTETTVDNRRTTKDHQESIG